MQHADVDDHLTWTSWPSAFHKAHRTLVRPLLTTDEQTLSDCRDGLKLTCVACGETSESVYCRDVYTTTHHQLPG